MFDITYADIIEEFLKLYSEKDYEYIKFAKILDIYQFDCKPTDDFICIEIEYIFLYERGHICFIDKNKYFSFIRNKKINKLK